MDRYKTCKEIPQKSCLQSFLLLSVILVLTTVLLHFNNNANLGSLFKHYSFPQPHESPVISLGPEWPDLALFVPVFPAGEAELNRELLRTLKFFWPQQSLKLIFLVDGELSPSVRDAFADRIKKAMENHTKSVQVKFNYIPKEVYGGRGHDRQQLIMFWADNFTNAEYVGFLDDDTMITNHVLLEDVFDEKGRPHVWGCSSKTSVRYWLNVAGTSMWTDNSNVEIMRTMIYFAVVVKTSHLREIRDSVLRHRPEFTNFDDFFKRGIIEEGRDFSQFNIMHQHLWNLKRDEYNWHLQPISAEDNHFEQINGTTYQMFVPKPRYSLHHSSDSRKNRPGFVEDVLKRGFCYSLTKSEFEANGEHSQLCKNASYTWDVVSKTPNLDQWRFAHLDWRWDKRTVDGHVKRIALNRARSDWNEEEIKSIFSRKL